MLDKLFGSRLRAKILCWLFLHPDERYFIRQLKGLLDEDSTNISREFARLERMGILTCQTEGPQKYYRVNHKQGLLFFTDIEHNKLICVDLRKVV